MICLLHHCCEALQYKETCRGAYKEDIRKGMEVYNGERGSEGRWRGREGGGGK